MFQQQLDSTKYFEVDEWTVSKKQHAALPTRGFRSIDLDRMAICLILLVVSMAGSFFLLEWIQGLILPSFPGGQEGPWLIRPVLALHFSACAIMSAVLVPVLTINMRRRWKAQDIAAGSKHDPYVNRPWFKLPFMTLGLFYACLYGFGATLYLYSWQIVGPEGIESQSPRGHRNYTFNQILWLETIPAGMRSKSLKKDGPWYQVQFTDGHKISFGPENEGSSAAEQTTIAAYIAEQSKTKWRVYGDALHIRRAAQ